MTALDALPLGSALNIAIRSFLAMIQDCFLRFSAFKFVGTRLEVDTRNNLELMEALPGGLRAAVDVSGQRRGLGMWTGCPRAERQWIRVNTSIEMHSEFFMLIFLVFVLPTIFGTFRICCAFG